MSKKAMIMMIAGTALLLLAGCNSAAAATASPATTPSAAAVSQPSSVPASVPAATTPATPAIPAPAPKEEEPKLYKISEVIKDAKVLMGKSVIIEGKIVSECGAGCWFTLNDGTGTIFVDLAPSNLTIPQKRGARARVFGDVTSEKGETYLIGTKVEF